MAKENFGALLVGVKKLTVKGVCEFGKLKPFLESQSCDYFRKLMF
jgi:hypothetical protein